MASDVSGWVLIRVRRINPLPGGGDSLVGDELLLSLRQAPVTLSQIHHVHPRSLITVVRSRDGGRTWDFDSATQLAAGGGQELGMVYLGDGVVAGCLAAHETNNACVLKNKLTLIYECILQIATVGDSSWA